MELEIRRIKNGWEKRSGTVSGSFGKGAGGKRYLEYGANDLLGCGGSVGNTLAVVQGHGDKY